MYSLVSAPVLGFDCARLTGGAELAEILMAALALDEAGLAAVAAQYGVAPSTTMTREMAWLEVGAVSATTHRVTDVLSATTSPEQAVAAPTEAAEAPANGFPVRPQPMPTGYDEETGREIGLVARLQRAPIGSVDRLIACIRDDIFAWTWTTASSSDLRVQSDEASRAISVICDAAAAAYLRDALSEQALECLSAPWARVSPELRATDLRLGPHALAIASLLDKVRTANADEMRRLDSVGDRWRKRQPSWTTAVHDATWAVSLTDRVREAAMAQLLLVQAVACAGWPLSGLAGGDWNVLSGAVHALVVRDVLTAETTHRLLAPYVEGMGPVVG